MVYFLSPSLTTLLQPCFPCPLVFRKGGDGRGGVISSIRESVWLRPDKAAALCWRTQKTSHSSFPLFKKHLDLLQLPDFASIGPTGFCTKHKHRQKFQNGNNSAKETGDRGGWCLWQDLPPHRLQQVRPLCGRRDYIATTDHQGWVSQGVCADSLWKLCHRHRGCFFPSLLWQFWKCCA